MNFEELKAAYLDANTQREGESIEDFYTRAWEKTPCIPYSDLPEELRKSADSISIARARQFILECMPLEDFEKYGSMLDSMLLKTLHEARYRMESENEVALIGSDIIDAWNSVTGDKLSPARRKNEAIKNGHITNLGGYQVSISNKKYRGAFDVIPNNYAYVSRVGADFLDNLQYEDGIIMTAGEELEKQIMTGCRYSGTKPEEKQMDVSLARQLFTALEKSSTERIGYSFTIYLPTFCAEMGIDASKSNSHNGNDFQSKMNPLKDYIGILNNSEFYRFLTIDGVNTKEKTITVSVPYMFHLLNVIRNDPDTKVLKKDKTVKYFKEPFNELMKSTIVSERDKEAVEVVNFLLCGVLERGSTKDSELYKNKNKKFSKNSADIITYEVTFRTLIDSISMFRNKIDSLNSTRNKNRKLGSTMEHVERIMKEKTDAYKYFTDFSMTYCPPTTTTLDSKIKITHTGVNGDYKKQ